MDSGQTSMHRDQDGAMVVRYSAGPQTALWITRDELLLRWRRSEVWLIAAGVTAVITAFRFVRVLIWDTGSPGRSYLWSSVATVVVTTLAIYVGIVLILAWFSLLEYRRGANRVRRYANPGAVLQVRYLSDGVELTTATESVAYPYDRIKRIRLREHTVALSGGFGLRVLPLELFPAEALSFLERSATGAVRTSRRR